LILTQKLFFFIFHILQCLTHTHNTLSIMNVCYLGIISIIIFSTHTTDYSIDLIIVKQQTEYIFSSRRYIIIIILSLYKIEKEIKMKKTKIYYKLFSRAIINIYIYTGDNFFFFFFLQQKISVNYIFQKQNKKKIMNFYQKFMLTIFINK